MEITSIQRLRSISQVGFFALFVLAPPLNIFRYDLGIGNFVVFGQNWTLGINSGIDSLQHDSSDAAMNVLLYGLLPVVSLAVGFLWAAWRWGRIYCGWLCPHFSVVELVNRLMQRATGKPSIWEKQALPEKQPDGSRHKPNRWYWLPTLIIVLVFSLLWTISMMTYLLPPFEIYSNLLNAELTRNQSIFLIAATTAFCIEFLVTRHLFCRFGCAVGLFQSLAWMANRRALIISFDSSRAQACKSCNIACDNSCPMRLQPRTLKRKMFSCTECGECVSACSQVQGEKQQSLLHWVQGDAAEKISEPPMRFPADKAKITYSKEPLWKSR